jgi:RNA polymerase sigma factor (sigma-70 family)
MSFYSTTFNDFAMLFQAFKNGDPVAFRHYFDLHHHSLYLIILGIVDDPEEAKDIIADTFEKLAKNREKINNPDHLGRYLFIVARNGAIDHFRKLEIRRKAQHELGQLEETVYAEPSGYEIVHAKLMESISFVIQKLPPQRKKIFLLFYFIDEDVRSIAKRLNLREQTVRNQLSRAIITLRKALVG